MAEPVILSDEPDQIKIQVDDPSKPKNIVSNVRKIPQKARVSDKLIGAFFGEDVNTGNIGEHLIKDYAEPAGKRILNTFAQTLLKKAGDAVQVLLFGKVINSDGPTDYTSFSNPNIKKGPVAHKLTQQVEQFAFSTRQEAVKVLDALKGRIATYGSASVLNYYELVGEQVDYMMADRGWLDLSTAEVRSAPEGFIIDLPRPIMLKR